MGCGGRQASVVGRQGARSSPRAHTQAIAEGASGRRWGRLVLERAADHPASLWGHCLARGRAWQPSRFLAQREDAQGEIRVGHRLLTTMHAIPIIPLDAGRAGLPHRTLESDVTGPWRILAFAAVSGALIGGAGLLFYALRRIGRPKTGDLPLQRDAEEGPEEGSSSLGPALDQAKVLCALPVAIYLIAWSLVARRLGAVALVPGLVLCAVMAVMALWISGRRPDYR